ncbi:SCP2 sterol-binding domain-containing protein [Thiothrix fructosivorans]|jgi:putative sterol carrier protein|uniref:SCP2 sterol-binding domain-containing protein n=1 Tax=Thiothrix fructosivorans TaxID=111770 RepID=A0A8B0SIS3_9GAMM|nr:SCP2 sterol-binding domain-containing protein [Thiothrix fructosivorans]MBO0615191.1 SCP2 sterol-binding domain-containing protein [Thiothrix fructosivorans]QTX09978.1 SCP2 sterol-binding domain-containing protein [Thiothrix fructosivorans]
MLKQITLASCLTLLLTAPVHAAEFMDAAWAKQACAAWNADSNLTSGLMDADGYSWIKNDNKRGYKLVQMYRTACGESTKVQLNITLEGDKATCSYGGAPDGKAMDASYDYLMHATDADWICMGEGKFGCGAMGAMSTGKLKFTGPKIEAMKVMGPFEHFLQLTGKVAGTKTECKAK